MSNFIVPHNTAWKLEFDELRAVLLSLLEGYNIDVQHVGSTAIPGLLAKPVLDIDIIIEDKALIYGISKRLENVGYLCRGEQGISGRYAFRQQAVNTPQLKNLKGWRKHHIYVCYSDSLALKNHLLFRDALLNDKKLVEEYSQLKAGLIREIEMTREMYTRRKTDFIISVLTTLGLDQDELNEIASANV